MRLLSLKSKTNAQQSWARAQLCTACLGLLEPGQHGILGCRLQACHPCTAAKTKSTRHSRPVWDPRHSMLNTTIHQNLKAKIRDCMQLKPFMSHESDSLCDQKRASGYSLVHGRNRAEPRAHPACIAGEESALLGLWEAKEGKGLENKENPQPIWSSSGAAGFASVRNYTPVLPP